MHDFLLAKEIIDETLRLAAEKNLKAVEAVHVEIGTVALAHDGLPEHNDDISFENLEFGLKAIAKNTRLEKSNFNIKKIAGDNWKITLIKGR